MSRSIYQAVSILVLVSNCAAFVLCFRPGRRRTLLFALSVAVILVVTVPLYQYWRHGPLLARVVPRGLLFLPSLFFLQRGRLHSKLYFVATLLTLTYLIPIWSAFFGSLVGQGDEQVYSHASLAATIALLAVYLVLVIRYGRRLFDRLFVNDSSRIWYLYSAFPIAALYALSNLFDTIPPSLGWMQQADLGMAFVLTLFMFFGLVLLCAAIITTHNKAMLDYELRLTKNILDYGQGYYELLAERQEELRVMRHDYRHHLNVLQGLIHTGQDEVAETYLSELSVQYDDSGSPVYSDNPVVDALIGSTAARCQSLGIAFETAVQLPKALLLPNHALCIVMGNLLENAVEACEAMPTGQARFIRLDVKRKGAQLAVRVENSFDGLVRVDDGKVRSRKPDGGTGLRSVRLIAERMGGGYHVQWEGNVFQAYVLLALARR